MARPRQGEEGGGHGPGGSPRVAAEKSKQTAREDTKSLDVEAEDLYDNVACTD